MIINLQILFLVLHIFLILFSFQLVIDKSFLSESFTSSQKYPYHSRDAIQQDLKEKLVHLEKRWISLQPIFADFISIKKSYNKQNCVTFIQTSVFISFETKREGYDNVCNALCLFSSVFHPYRMNCFYLCEFIIIQRNRS